MIPVLPCSPPQPRLAVPAGLFYRKEVLSECDLLRVSRQIGRFRKTLGLSLGLSKADIDNLKFKEEDAYEVHTLENIGRLATATVASGCEPPRVSRAPHLVIVPALFNAEMVLSLASVTPTTKDIVG